MNVHQASREAERIGQLLTDALNEHRRLCEEFAAAQRAYRRAKAAQWPLTAGQGMLAEQRKAQVDANVADLCYARDLAEGLKQSALEAVRSHRTELTVVQSLMGAYREEAAYDRTGPAVTP